MRLVNVHSLELEEFFDDQIPKYAILSHTWGEDEVSFQDLSWLNSFEKNKGEYSKLEDLLLLATQKLSEKADSMRKSEGYQKIVQSALLSREAGISYVWVDTCCIDKTSSSELSEAINSMFRWYNESFICYAYLSDLPADDSAHQINEDDRPFRYSRWFTRGWTLQELLAPSTIYFYNQDWQMFGDKHSLAAEIAKITGIPKEYLLYINLHDIKQASVAERMSWARRRHTTRKEDMAYCLLGIFDVNMPLLYGEGEKAFIRLQQHIIQQSDDKTIFTWGYNMPYPGYGDGIFAPSPACFFYGGGVTPCSYGAAQNSSFPFTLTNKGLHIKLLLYKRPDPGSAGTVYAVLDCIAANDRHTQLAIPLIPICRKHDWQDQDEYRRLEGAAPVCIRTGIPLCPSIHKSIFIKPFNRPTQWLTTTVPTRTLSIYLHTFHFQHKVDLAEAYPHEGWRLTLYVIDINMEEANLLALSGTLYLRFVSSTFQSHPGQTKVVLVVEINFITESGFSLPVTIMKVRVVDWDESRHLSIADEMLHNPARHDPRSWFDRRGLEPQLVVTPTLRQLMSVGNRTREIWELK